MPWSFCRRTSPRLSGRRRVRLGLAVSGSRALPFIAVGMCYWFDAAGIGRPRFHAPAIRRGVRASPSATSSFYSGVMAQAARFRDMMLAALLSKVPPDTTALLLGLTTALIPAKAAPSASRPVPPGASADGGAQRLRHLRVLRGPGLKRDHLLRGTSILDVTPTLLALQGRLPLGEDMDGRPALDAWEQPPAVGPHPVVGRRGRRRRQPPRRPPGPIPGAERAAARSSSSRSATCSDRHDNVEEAVRETQRELDMNLRSRRSSTATAEAEALPILRELCAQWPEGVALSPAPRRCAQTLGRVDELREVVERLQRPPRRVLKPRARS